MRKGVHLFTSESVGQGHPDKVADQVSDAVLDALISRDPMSRVACETLVTTGLCLVAGEVTSKAFKDVDLSEVARKAILDIGYNDAQFGIDGNSCSVLMALHAQSPDIAQGVDLGKEIGAGDQGMMFGFACDETPELMPLPITLSHRIMNKALDARQKKEIKWLRPDGKCQVTVEYSDMGKPTRIHTIVLSHQHDESIVTKGKDGKEVITEEARKTLIEKVIKPVMPPNLLNDKIIYHINPTGKFVVGGPHGDCGLTGRKIIVDTYGGMGRHGGGAFSGKDPTKVDRSAAYMARHIAKNLVAAKLASRVEVQLAYAIGVAEPVSVFVDAFGTATIDESKFEGLVREHFKLTPKGIIDSLDLRRGIYGKTCVGGHFGRNLPELTWEKTDKADALKKSAKA